MRHGKKVNHLGRTSAHREAMLSNMASSLFLHKRVATTLAKAKALRPYVEHLITKSKLNTTHSRRTVFSYLQNKFAVKALFDEISPAIMNRPGGYTRILKTGFRYGDGAETCFIELVDFPVWMAPVETDGIDSEAAESAEMGKKRRTRRGSAKKKADAETESVAAAE